MITHCTRPAKTGCRYRFTGNNQSYWVSCPKRGAVRAWVALVVPVRVRGREVPGVFTEKWLSVPLVEAVEECARFYKHDDRNPRFSALLRDYEKFLEENPEFRREAS